MKATIMKVLYLCNRTAQDLDYIPKIIERHGDEVVMCFDRFDQEFLINSRVEFIVSYRYQYLIKEPILSAYKDRMINCHPSFLPWNKGYYPNAWSIIDETPKGSTILRIDEGIDTGDILVQQELQYSSDETLKETYDRCHQAVHQLFEENWLKIRNGEIRGTKQKSMGTHHYKKEFAKLEPLLARGWDTTISEFQNRNNLIAQK